MARSASHSEHILGSTAAGIASTILGHPLDAIKTHLQTNPKLLNSFQTMQELKFGIFRGIGPPLCSAIAMNTVMFSVFDQVNKLVGDPFLAGILRNCCFDQSQSDYLLDPKDGLLRRRIEGVGAVVKVAVRAVQPLSPTVRHVFGGL